MKTYQIAAMVRHSGEHIQFEVGAYGIPDALWHFNRLLDEQGLHIDAISELDITELPE
jgi:hypothetical protein